MLYEHHFECKTRGLVQGYSLLNTNIPVSANKFLNSKRFNFENLNKQEFFIDETSFDVRKDSIFTLTWKVVIRSRKTKEIIWSRPFSTKTEALFVYSRLIGLDIERYIENPVSLPGIWQEGDFEYVFATVQSFTATGTTTWTAPIGINKTDYLVVAGGGGGGSLCSGGGGAGGLLTGNIGVAPSNNYTVTVGTGGAGGNSQINNTAYAGSNGVNSVFYSITSTGGGGGGSRNTTAPVGPYAGGSGGGASFTGTGGAGTAGQGFAGGNGLPTAVSPYDGGGGGGAGAAGANGTSSSAGNGGVGVSSNISGSTVVYAGGGGAGSRTDTGTATIGTGGNGGGGNGALAYTGTAGNGATNTGGGGGGGGTTDGTPGPNSSSKGGNGGSGIVILSYTPSSISMFNSPILGI